MNIFRLEEENLKIKVFHKLGITQTEDGKIAHKLENDTLQYQPEDIDYWNSEHTYQI